MTKRIPLLIHSTLSAALVLTVAACTGTPMPERVSSSSATPASSASSSARSAPSTDSASPGTTVDLLSTPPAPASVDTAAEQAAWAALMAPTGEYAAAASYAAVLAAYGEVQPYARILPEEERHIAALTRQLQRMGVEVPANPYLGHIAAPADLQTAATNWAQGEIANVALYDQLSAQASGDVQLTKVFSNLRRASAERHLPAFEAAAANGGTTS